MAGLKPSEIPADETTTPSASPKFSGDVRRRFEKVLPHVKRATFGAKDPQDRKTKRNAAFVAADSLMQEVTPIIEQSKIDSLTGLNTKVGFNEILALEAAKAKESGQKLMVVFVDLNEFKPVNDKLGHGAGDEVISQFGNLIKESMRPTDVAGRVEEESGNEEASDGHAGRFGGDEFVVLLKDADAVAVNSFFNRLSTRLTSIPIYETLLKNGLNVSMSAGTAEVDLDNPSKSLMVADSEMYKAKDISHRNPNTNQLSIGQQQPTT